MPATLRTLFFVAALATLLGLAADTSWSFQYSKEFGPPPVDPLPLPEVPPPAPAAPAEPDPLVELPPAPQPPDAPPAAEPAVDDSAEPTRPPPKPFTSAREMLALFDIDFSTLRFLIDGRPLDPEERETTLRILQQVPQITPPSYHEWQIRNVTWAQLTEKPDANRAEVFYVPCRAKQVDVMPLRPEQTKRFEMKSYFQVRAELTGSPQEVIILARDVPKDWKLGTPIDERAGFWGLFLKTGALPAEPDRLSPLYFAAQHVAWLPDQADAAAGVSAAKQKLGDLGFDVTFLDKVADRQRILTSEREGFYQLLEAVRRGGEQKPLFKYQEKASPLGPLLTDSRQLRGEWVTVEGRVRQATKIMVNDPDIRPRIGFDHYYQVMLFVDEPVRVSIVREQGKPPATVDFSTYPVVLCVLELPPQIKVNEPLDVQAQLTGWYYKLYSYDSQFMEEKRAELGLLGDTPQFSPLVIGDRPIVILEEAKPPTNYYIGPIVMTAVVVVLVLFFFNARRLSHTDSLPDKIEIGKSDPTVPHVDAGEVHVDPYKKKEG